MRHSRLAGAALLGMGACANVRVEPRAPGAPQRASPAMTAVIVQIPKPWYAPRALVRRRFFDALGAYEAQQAIHAKYFSLGDDNRYGGLYVWSSRPAADRHFDDRWRADVRRRRGAAPDVRFLPIVWIVEGSTRPLGRPEGQRSVAFPATGTFASWRLDRSSRDHATHHLAERLSRQPGLFRAFVVTLEDPDVVGALAVWASREHAEAALPTLVDAEANEILWFETPLLVDATLRRP